MNYGSIYLIVRDFEKSIDFYKKLLEKNVDAQNMTRFAIFNIDGLCLAINSGTFDTENQEKVEYQGAYYEEYDDQLSIIDRQNSGKIVINLSCENLNNEYDRIMKLGIGKDVTEIRYVNAGMPYYYFTLKDPDDNVIEITGEYLTKEE